MTKLKSKKITKSTVAVIIMAIAMVAMLAFGGTYAYFTAVASDTTATTITGIISLSSDQTTALQLTKQNVLPKENLLTATDTAALNFSADDATRAQVAFFSFSVAATKGGNAVSGLSLTLTLPTGADIVECTGEYDTTNHLSFPANTIAVFIPAGEDFDMNGLQVALDEAANSVNTQGGSVPDKMGATVTLTIEAESIQALYVDGNSTVQELTASTASSPNALTAAHAKALYNILHPYSGS